MKYQGTMLVVKDIEKSIKFYKEILGVEIISDFGENVTFTGGFSIQTEDSWMEFTGCSQAFFTYEGNVMELYFEEEEFEGFLQKIETKNIALISNSVMPWGKGSFVFMILISILLKWVRIWIGW